VAAPRWLVPVVLPPVALVAAFMAAGDMGAHIGDMGAHITAADGEDMEDMAPGP
jgi:hypothetical protein